nr:hypothetical protein [uncultured archaeon]
MKIWGIMKMNNNGRIKPVHGNVYYLHAQKFHGMFSNHESFDGLYIGLNPVETEWFSRIERPEGHTFVRQNKEGELEVYCNRNNRSLRMTYWCDGEDDPAYPVGIDIERVDYEFSKEEKEYLLERIKSKQNKEKLKNAV